MEAPFRLADADAARLIVGVSRSDRWRSTIAGTSTGRIGLAIFLGTLVVHAAFIALLPADWRANHSVDFIRYYEPAARRLAEGFGLTTAEGQVAIRFPPGFPIILAATKLAADAVGLAWMTVLAGVVLCLSALSAVLLFVLAERIVGRWIALLAATLFALHPLYLWLLKQPNSEVPFIVLVLGAVILAQGVLDAETPSLTRVAGVGVLYGLAALVRPIAIGVVLPTAITFLWRGRSLGRATRALRCCVLAGAFLVTVSPWEAWVWAQTGRVIPLGTTEACNTLYGLAVEPGSSNLPGRVPLAPSFARLAVDAERAMTNPNCIAASTELLGRWARERPWDLTRALANKALRAWYSTNAHWFELYALQLNVLFLLVTGFGMFSAWRSSDRAKSYAIHSGLLTAYFWGMAFLVLSIVRYMVPAIVLLLPMTALGIVRAVEAARGLSPHADRAALAPPVSKVVE